MNTTTLAERIEEAQKNEAAHRQAFEKHTAAGEPARADAAYLKALYWYVQAADLRAELRDQAAGAHAANADTYA